MTAVEPDRPIARHVRITGRVQGVWFRAWTAEEAGKRGLAGWVRNRIDGSVEALFAGPEAAVADMIAACREGPPAARVMRVVDEPYHVKEGSEDGPTGFTQRPTI